MAEIIKFPGADEGHVDGPDLSERIAIPSIDLLYDEDQIMVMNGQTVSVSRMKDFMKKRNRINALGNLEIALAQARGRFIVKNSTTEAAEKDALVGLARHTYVIGRELNREELMDWAIRELRRGLGTTQAMHVIENINLKDNLK